MTITYVMSTKRRRAYPRIDPSVRFWARVDKSGDCWLWLGNHSGTGGYGCFVLSTKVRVKAHRYAYEQLVGPIPVGLFLDHLCRNPQCVNPAHLEPVTNRENVRRGKQGVLKTHCPAGHEYVDSNVYRSPRGERRCRECNRIRGRSLRHRATPKE